MPKSNKAYQCSICKLHYSDKKWADECFKWCSTHDSCNLAVTKHSLERQKK